jgi:hypothetical protein
MSAKYQYRRDSDAQRRTIILDTGEPFFTTDTKKLFVGDGVTVGGIFIGPRYKGSIQLVSGQDYITVTGAALPFTPTSVLMTVRKAGSSDANFGAELRGLPTSGGFTADLDAIPPDNTYYLDYEYI